MNLPTPDNFCKWNHIFFVYPYLACLTKHVFKVHCVAANTKISFSQVNNIPIWHKMTFKPIHSSTDGHLHSFHLLACEQCCYEWGCAHTPSILEIQFYCKHSYGHLWIYCLCCFPGYMNTWSCSAASGPTKPKILLIYPFTEKVCWSLVYMMGFHSENGIKL